MQNKDLIKTLEEQNSLLIEEQKELKEHLGHKYGEKQAVIIELSDTIRENIKTIIGIKKYNLDNARRSLVKNDCVEFKTNNETNNVDTENKDKEILEENDKKIYKKYLGNDENETRRELRDKMIDFGMTYAPKKVFGINIDESIQGVTENIISILKSKKIMYIEAFILLANTNETLEKMQNCVELKKPVNILGNNIEDAEEEIIKIIINILKEKELTYDEAYATLKNTYNNLKIMSEKEYL